MVSIASTLQTSNGSFYYRNRLSLHLASEKLARVDVAYFSLTAGGKPRMCVQIDSAPRGLSPPDTCSHREGSDSSHTTSREMRTARNALGKIRARRVDAVSRALPLIQACIHSNASATFLGLPDPSLFSICGIGESCSRTSGVFGAPRHHGAWSR